MGISDRGDRWRTRTSRTPDTAVGRCTDRWGDQYEETLAQGVTNLRALRAPLAARN